MTEVGITPAEAKAALLGVSTPRVGEVYEVLSNRYLQAYKGDHWSVVHKRLVSYAVLVSTVDADALLSNSALVVPDERFEQMLRDGHLKLVGTDMKMK